jgi:hypothetical protein
MVSWYIFRGWGYEYGWRCQDYPQIRARVLAQVQLHGYVDIMKYGEIEWTCFVGKPKHGRE